jgi:Holliday junction DNA helicase RuvA
MISRLRGEVIEHDGARVVIDCGGVGYGVLVVADEQQRLSIGSKCDLYIAENIKEDTHDLFGFERKSRMELFRLLTSVNGVGPKAGMAILSVGTEPQVRAAVATGDTKLITAAKGVGKKVAERVIVDLKNKVGFDASSDATDFLSEVPTSDEAVQALVSLGHSTQDALILLKNVDSTLPTQDRVRAALKASK